MPGTGRRKTEIIIIIILKTDQFIFTSDLKKTKNYAHLPSSCGKNSFVKGNKSGTKFYCRERERERERKRDRQTHRQTETETEAEAEAETDRQRQTDRDRQTETDRQRQRRETETDTETETQTDRQRDRETDSEILKMQSCDFTTEFETKFTANINN